MKRVGRVALFWYDFIVGDDWLLAAGVVVALVAAVLVSNAGSSIGWLALPIIVICTLVVSIRRAVPPDHHHDDPPGS
jgi:hypothetical protein